MKRLCIFFLGACLLLFTSCWGLLNDNYQLYGSEWSTEDTAQGLKFYNDDSVLFFWELGRQAGTYDYNASIGIVELSGLHVTLLGETAEFTAAEVFNDGTMKLYWHYLGQSENYYTLLYKRR